MNTKSLRLRDFITNLAEALRRLKLDEKYATLESWVEAIRQQLHSMRSQCSGDVPAEAGKVQQLMLRVFDLYDQSIDQQINFLRDRDFKRLDESVAFAQTAHDVLLAVEDVIRNNKRVLEQMAAPV
jgi:GTP cyclohydrolase FolE2